MKMGKKKKASTVEAIMASVITLFHKVEIHLHSSQKLMGGEIQCESQCISGQVMWVQINLKQYVGLNLCEPDFFWKGESPDRNYTNETFQETNQY